MQRSQVYSGAQKQSVQHPQVRSGAQNLPAQRPQVRPVSRMAVQSRAMEQRRLRQQAIRRKRILMGVVELLAVVALGLVVILMVSKPRIKQTEPPFEEVYQPVEAPVQQNVPEERIQGLSAEIYAKHPDWTEDFLTPNEYSRPGDPLTQVNNIFVHYTANPGTSAAQNRSYFEQQKDTHEASVSSHFIIGYNGEILQIVPLDEIAYAVMTRNEDSISIECCYKAENGQFTQETYDSLISLLSWLTEAYDLDSEDILRHYDCGGKKCPLYYTEHEDAWERLKKDVANYTL